MNLTELIKEQDDRINDFSNILKITDFSKKEQKQYVMDCLTHIITKNLEIIKTENDILGIDED